MRYPADPALKATPGQVQTRTQRLQDVREREHARLAAQQQELKAEMYRRHPELRP